MKFYLKTRMKSLQPVALVICLPVIHIDLLITGYGMLFIIRGAVVISQP